MAGCLLGLVTSLSFRPLSCFHFLHLSFLYGRLCSCLICREMNDSDSPDLAPYQSRSESNTICECVCERAYVPCLTHNTPGSVTLWQKALIFQYYHTPLSQVSHSCTLPYHPLSPYGCCTSPILCSMVPPPKKKLIKLPQTSRLKHDSSLGPALIITVEKEVKLKALTLSCKDLH